MAYSPKNGTSAKTRDGRKAVFVRYDDRNWPAPFIFSVDGENLCFSVGGFAGNHWNDSDPLDLVCDWQEPDLQEVNRKCRARIDSLEAELRRLDPTNDLIAPSAALRALADHIEGAINADQG